MIKNPLFFAIHDKNKNVVLLQNCKSKWPYPKSEQSTRNPLFTMTTNQRACKQTCDDDTNLFPTKPASRLGPVLEKRGSQKDLGDAWISFHPTDVVNLAW